MMKKRKKSSNNHDPRRRSASIFPSVTNVRVPVGAAIIVAAVLLVYFPSINGGFVLDDNLLLTENNIIKASNGLYRFWCTTEATDYWPATNTTLWIEWRLWGMNSTGYHVTNLILHIVESLLVWLILRKMAIPGAFLAALIFAVHPVNVESAAWIASRKNLMAMLFILLSILWYLEHLCSRRTPCAATALGVDRLHSLPPPLWYWLSLAAFVLAMFSKGSAAVLPVLLLGIIRWLRPLTRMDILRSVPFFLITGVLSGVNVWFQTHGSEIVIRTAGFTERLLGAGSAVWFYLYKALLPFDLAFVYRPWRIEASEFIWWLPLSGVLVVTAVLWRYRERWSGPCLFAWGFFCVALVPVMGFTDVGFMKHSLVADRYQHIAIIGVIALAAAGWSAWHQRAREITHWRALAVAIAAVGTLAFLSWRQNEIYRDPVTLYRAALAKNPEFWMGYYNLGKTLFDKGQLQEAIGYYEQALRVKPNYPEAHNNLGLALVKSDRTGEAIEHYQQALRYKPDYPDAHFNLGIALERRGLTEDAIDQYQQTVRLQPDYVDAHYNLGNAYKAMGQYQLAIEHYEKALRFKPAFVEANLNLGVTLVQAGRTEEAIKFFEQALRLKPGYDAGHINLGAALVQTGRLPEAIEQYQQALRINPNSPEAHNNFGKTLLDTGRLDEAIEQCRQALRLQPDYPDAHYNLGNALVQTGRPKEAIEHFQQTLRLKPDYTNVYYTLALAYAHLGQTSEAVAAAQKGLELARSQGQPALTKKIEEWLNSYRAGKRD